MKCISAVTIGKLIEAHREHDEEKFLEYAKFVGDAYREAGENRNARIIYKRIFGEYKKDPKDPRTVLDEQENNIVYVERIQMKKYIGCKLVQAEPMTRGAYNCFRGWMIPKDEDPEDEGYLVRYPDGYLSWSPKNIFERAYMEVEDNKDLPSGVSIGQKMVDDFITLKEVKTWGDRTTVVRCVLRNGFEIVESSSCVDPKNYSEELGEKICIDKIRDKVWELLGFLLQTAWNGIQ